MKQPKAVKRHCPRCRKHTETTVAQVRQKARNASRPLSRGSTARVRGRGQRRGAGNLGRYSKPTKPKLSGKKLSKKIAFKYTCKECKKSYQSKATNRAKKLEMV